mmetsp:Transcript_5194/g.11401  ORF Transcript_5194/g.11401 Transcript_5194/m.11401 type:complete len:97 (-) Transcript_5194:688-978(-)
MLHIKAYYFKCISTCISGPRLQVIFLPSSTSNVSSSTLLASAYPLRLLYESNPVVPPILFDNLTTTVAINVATSTKTMKESGTFLDAEATIRCCKL